MAEKTKNLCAQIPERLHDEVRKRQSESGKTLSEYMTWLITTFYEKEKKPMDNLRTLAIQIDADLFDRLDAYLKENGLKKRTFITMLIEQALDEAAEE